jgi:anti-sigma-K factor RskA
MDIQAYISSGIIELYVMGLCSPEEEKELEQLRGQHPALQEAIVAYELQLEKNMLQNSTLPSATTDERILNKLASLQQVPVVQMRSEPPVKKLNWWKTVAAAAVLLLGVSTYFNYTLYKKNNEIAAIPPVEKGTLPLADYEVITNPAITPVGMYGQGSHAICRCTMFWDKKTGKAYVMIHHLPKSNESTDFQLWAEVDGKPVSVGIIDDAIRGKFIEVASVPAGAVAFKVTLGKAGGESSPENGDLYLAGKI